MSDAPRIEDVLKDYLSNQQGGSRDADEKLCTLLLEFSELLFGENEDQKEDRITLKNLGSFELDEFLHFFLTDMHPDDSLVQSRAKDFLKRFRKFLEKRNLLGKAQLEDWKEFFQENGI
ncbi:hypothetical protein LEP1GSC050_1555 [Leptospira broomii serovar Hurstbridge str. 5399]|uniref:Uncharacterized protein n=4 Tax=Leptospira TaxID=171 RepID=V6HCU7_9LEPT|nr:MULTISPECIES: hypothetical protein [Leptospira]EPG75385.1 hypothetical protein LEP1GSC058_2130 [Leptospira fainei serovar Hurstbridge str. BUT 6]EQA37537.1 hypothetical protein LEP1GSC047_4374 [Leptospira inadai serovar Lyme str. 10]EQA43306.1 hypothetical protein LEP1GSC050_1555 [Leptospira broomii serovar Hurstbridge str. 5399]PNV72784.1 hypothetical protein BES34_018630 [Leptospira inadai serovar Lyme]